MSEEGKPPNLGKSSKDSIAFNEVIKKSFKMSEKKEAIIVKSRAQAPNNLVNTVKFRKDLKNAFWKFQAEKAAENARKLAEGEGASKVGRRRVTEVTPPNSNGTSPLGVERTSIDNIYSNQEEMTHDTSIALPPESPDSQSANCTTQFRQEESCLVDKDTSVVEAPSDRQTVVLGGVGNSLDGQQQSVTTTTPQCDERTRENGNSTSREERLSSSSGKTFESGVEVVEEASSSDSEMCSNEAEVELVSSTVLSPTRTDEDLRQDSARGNNNELSSSQNIVELMNIDSNPSSADKDKEGTSAAVEPVGATDDAIIGRKRPAEETNGSGSSKRCRVNADNNKENENDTLQSSSRIDTHQVNVLASAENDPRSVSFQTEEHEEDAYTSYTRLRREERDSSPELTEEEARAANRPTLTYLKQEPGEEPVRTGRLHIRGPPKRKPIDPNYVPIVITISDSEDDDFELSSRSSTTTWTTSSTTTSSFSTRTVQPSATTRSCLPITTTPTIMSTSTSTTQPCITTSSTPTIMSTSSSTVQPTITTTSCLPTSTTPTIMSTSTSTTPTIMSTSTSTVVSAETPISSLLTAATPTTNSASSRSIVETVTTETASFVANTPIIDDFVSRPTILPTPSVDPEACFQSVALNSETGISRPPMPSNSSTALLPSSVSQTEESNDISANICIETTVTVSEVTSEATLATRNDEVEASVSTGTANQAISPDKTAAITSTGDGPSDTAAQVTPIAIADIKRQPDLDEDETEMPDIRIRDDIFVTDDDEDIDDGLNLQPANESLSLAQVIANFTSCLTPEECSVDIDTMRSLSDLPLPASVSELVAVSRILTPDIVPSLPPVSVTASSSSSGVPVSSDVVVSAIAQTPGTSSGTFSGTSSSVTVVPATRSAMAPTTVEALLAIAGLEAEGNPSTTVSSAAISPPAVSTPVTSASPIAPVSSALVPMPTTSSTSSCSTVEVPTTSPQVHQRRTSSPAIANSPWSELEEPLKDLKVGMDIIVKAAEENLAYVKQLAASLQEPAASTADVIKKMSTLSEARQKSFTNHDTVDNVIISLRMKHTSLSTPEPRVRMEAAKPTVEELAAYFEVLLESVILSKRPHVNERMRGVLVVQITRLMRILGHYMHVPENFSRSEQTFMNVLAVLSTKPGLVQKYTTSNLNYMLLNFWQCIRGVTRDTGYAKGAMMDHTNLGPKNFMDRVEKFKISYERNVAKGAPQVAPGPSQVSTQSHQPQQQVSNQTQAQPQQQNRAQLSVMWQNQQQQQGATSAPAVRHQQHQFITPSQVVQQQPQQVQHTNQSQVMQQQLQQRQFTTSSQVVQQQPQQLQHTNQSQGMQQQLQRQFSTPSQVVQQQTQQHQYANQSQVTQQQSQQQQYAPQSQVTQQQYTSPSQVTQQVQQQQYATQQQTVRHPQQQQLQQLLQNPSTNLQSQSPRQTQHAQYLRVQPIRQEHSQNASQFQGQVRTAPPQHTTQSSSSPQQNQIAQQLRPQNMSSSTSQQRHFHPPPPQQPTAQLFVPPRQCSPNTASLLQRQAHFNMASQQQQNSAGQGQQQPQYFTQQPSAQQVHTAPPRNVVGTIRQSTPPQLRHQSQVFENTDANYARQQLANANGQYRQRSQSQQQQRTHQQMPAPQIQQHRHASRSPQLQQQQMTTQQQLQQQMASLQQLQQQQMSSMQQLQQQQMSSQYQLQQQQQQQMTSQQQIQRQMVAINSVSNAAGATYIDDDIEILEVRPPSNPPVSRSPVETQSRILVHMCGEQIGSVPYTGPNAVASPRGQVASLSRRSSSGQENSLDGMTLEGLLNNTPAANRVVVTPTNVVRPNSRSRLSPISPPVNVAGRRTAQDAHMTGTNNQHSTMGVGQLVSLNNRHPNRNSVQQGHINIQLNQQASSLPYNQQNQQLTLNYQQESESSMQTGNQAQSVSVPARVTSSRTRLSNEMNSPSGMMHYVNVDHGSGQRSSPSNYSSTPGPEIRISRVASLANTAPNSSRRSSQSSATIPDIAYAQMHAANTVYFPDMEGNSVAHQPSGQMQTHSNNNTVSYNGVGGGNFSSNNFGNT